ncbi:MAG TPA: rhodanese-like domain-containing protein [Methanothrix sp.]|nr:rhodanese-like domain-containing protein [Methanothrix sp.]
MGALLVGSASAGGNMNCPDCPDWSNLDAWWAKYHKTNAVTDPSPSTAVLNQAAQAQNSSSEAQEGGGGYPNDEILIRPGADLDGKVLLDARSPEDYEKGHLPGARNLYWRLVREGEVLDPNLAVEELRRLGVNETDPVVVYGRGDDSAYLFWVLDYLGHEDLSLLDGDVEAFPELDLVENAPEAASSNYTPALRSGILVNGTMLAQAKGSIEVQIVDTRSSYSDFASSRISNSMYVRPTDIYSDPEARTLKSPEELDQLFLGRGIDKDKVQIVYGTPEACGFYFALKAMGYRATVLDGTWWKKTDFAVSSIS